MSDVKLSSFPSHRFEALAMLYLQQQDLSELSPEELLEEYLKTIEKIKAHNKELHKDNSGWLI